MGSKAVNDEFNLVGANAAACSLFGFLPQTYRKLNETVPVRFDAGRQGAFDPR